MLLIIFYTKYSDIQLIIKHGLKGSPSVIYLTPDQKVQVTRAGVGGGRRGGWSLKNWLGIS